MIKVVDFFKRKIMTLVPFLFLYHHIRYSRIINLVLIALSHDEIDPQTRQFFVREDVLAAKEGGE